MRDEFQIFDADRHVLEPLAMWAEYLPARLQDWAPVLTTSRGIRFTAIVR